MSEFRERNLISPSLLESIEVRAREINLFTGSQTAPCSPGCRAGDIGGARSGLYGSSQLAGFCVRLITPPADGW